MPSIMTFSKATQSNSSSNFGSFIGYIGREDAFNLKELDEQEIKNILLKDKEYTDSEFQNYIYYQKNSLKAKGIFDRDNDFLNKGQQNDLVSKVEKAEKNGSPLFQDVITFDNKYLEKVGMYNSRNGILNEKKLKEAVRTGMEKMLKDENFKGNDNTIWSGAIHRNTDNIHVHIATTEINTTRPKMLVADKDNPKHNHYEYRVKRKLSSIENLKKTVLNEVTDEKTKNKRLGLLKDIDKEMNLIKDNFQEDTLKKSNMLKSVIKELPMNKMSEWRYKSNAKEMKKPQSLVNKYIDNSLNNELKPNYQVFNSLIEQQDDMYKEMYGNYERDKFNKVDRLKEQLANNVYKNIKSEVNNVNNNFKNLNLKSDLDIDDIDKILNNYESKSFYNDKNKMLNKNKQLSKRLDEIKKDPDKDIKEYIKIQKEININNFKFKVNNNDLSIDEKIIFTQNQLDDYKSKYGFDDKQLFDKNGIVNFDKENIHHVALNDYAKNYVDLNFLKTKKRLDQNINQNKKLIKDNIKIVKDRKSGKQDKIKSKKIVEKAIQDNKLNYKMSFNNVNKSKDIKKINHLYFRSKTVPSYKLKFKNKAKEYENSYRFKIRKQNKELKDLSKPKNKSNSNNLNRAKNKVMQSSRSIKSILSSLNSSSKTILTNMNQMEREQHKMKVNEFREQQKIKQSIYYDEQDRER